jgi:hypothetical protein
MHAPKLYQITAKVMYVKSSFWGILDIDLKSFGNAGCRVRISNLGSYLSIPNTWLKREAAKAQSNFAE